MNRNVLENFLGINLSEKFIQGESIIFQTEIREVEWDFFQIRKWGANSFTRGKIGRQRRFAPIFGHFSFQAPFL